MSETETVKSKCLQCDKCDGKGKVNHWYAMDESEIIDCPKCNGKGVVWIP